MLARNSNILDDSSIMKEPSTELNARIAERVRGLRAERGLSLDALATRSGVSRSMISLIERGENNPTAVLLDRLAQALDVPLASLFDNPTPPPEPIARRAAQTVWRDPASGYLRRSVSPGGPDIRTQLVEVEFPPQARVAYDSLERLQGVQQLVWLLEGRLQLTVDQAVHTLEAGDCLAMTLGVPIVFHNPGQVPARYAVVLTRS